MYFIRIKANYFLFYKTLCLKAINLYGKYALNVVCFLILFNNISLYLLCMSHLPKAGKKVIILGFKKQWHFHNI